MAWLDDRFWCHPKITGLGDRAYRAYVNGVTYSSGFSTKGVLTDSQLRTIKATPKVRKELVEATLWEELPNGAVHIHDWDTHNGKRDERKAADRERKRKERSASAGHDADKTADVRKTSSRDARGRAPDDGSEGSDGVTGSEANSGLALPALDLRALPNYEGHEAKLWKRLCVAAGVASKPKEITKLENVVKAHRSTERELVMAIEAATGPGVNDPLAVALAELKNLALERKRGAA